MLFRVLGALEVSVDGRQILLGGPKQRMVLASLLLHPNRVVSAEELIDQVWAEDPPHTARKTLQGYVTHLRRALGPDRLEWRAPGYVLRVGPRELDVARFESLVHEARAVNASPDRASALYRRALGQWRGQAFADLATDGAIAAEAHRLEELRLEALEGRIAADLEAGRHGELVSELTALTREHPLREQLCAHLMVALYRSNRQADASRAYHRAREVLAEELGLYPSQELKELHDRILRNDPALEAPHERLRGYELVEEIGEGAFGTVHRAWQPQLAREVAIKAIRPTLANDPEFIRRFETEAQLIARLEHTNIVPLYDYWREPGAAYVVMRWIRGGSLDETSRSPFDLETVARVEEQIAGALSFAHRLGVVHSDIKPANVLLDEAGNAYLSDFGIAPYLRGLGAEERDVRLSPAYLSPEQIRGEPTAPATDIYSLGLLLYQMLCGSHPFSGAPPVLLLQKHLREPLPPITASRPDLPAVIDDVIARATAKDPEARFPDVIAFDLAFRQALEPRGTGALGSKVELVNPYKGLRPFGEADALDFFGRETLIDRLVARLCEVTEGNRFAAVVGPSGSGKSSAVRAGLVPALRAGALPGSDTWFFVEMRPGGRPFEELEMALRRIATDPPATLVDDLQGDRSLADAVDLVLPPDGSELFLVIDQLEELFTHVDDEETKVRFLACLATAVSDPRSRVRVVVTLRADYFDRPLVYPEFGWLLASRTEVVTQLTPAELELAIAGPAERVGVSVAPELLAEIVADSSGRPGALPLLQYALTESFERGENGALTLSTYQEVGGVGGALAGRAEHLYDAMAQDEWKEATRQLFLRLVAVTGRIEDLRRRVRRSELDSLEGDQEAMTAAIDAFTHHRLLTSDRDPATREPTVEVAHETLLHAWPRLRAWIDASREDLRNHHRLATEAGQWEDAGRDVSFLLRGSRLEHSETWAAETDIALASSEREYLTASLDQRERERGAEQAQREREASFKRRSLVRLRALAAVLTVGAIVASVLALVAVDRGRRAEREARIASARELAAAATANLGVDAERSLRLALRAVETTYRIDSIALPEAEEALHRALQADRLVLTLPGYSAQYSTDGKRLLVVGAKGFQEGGNTPARTYDAQTGKLIRTATGRGRGDAAFSPDGELFATSDWGRDGSTYVWDATTGQTLGRFGHHGGLGLLFSPNHQLLAYCGRCGDEHPKTWVFDLRLHGRVNVLDGPDPLAFSPDGERLLMADALWDAPLAAVIVDPTARTGGPDVVKLVEEPQTIPRAGAWSRDGIRVATLTNSAVVVWSARTGRESFRIFPPIGGFTSVSFGPGSLLATGMDDGTTIVWRLLPDGAEPALTVGGHDAKVGSVSFNADGTRLATSSDDGEVMVWDISPGGTREVLNMGGSGAVAFSPDGRLIAVGNNQGHVALHDVATGRTVFVVRRRGGPVNAIDFDPMGKALAVAESNGRVWLADTATGAQRLTVPDRPFDSAVLDVQFNPDGRTFATATFADDKPVNLWKAETGDRLSTLSYRVSDANAGHAVAFSPDGRFVSGSGFTFVRIWNLADTSYVQIRAGVVNALAFSADGTSLAAGVNDGSLRLWNPRTGREVKSIHRNLGEVTDVAYSPDGAALATSSTDGTVRIWDADTLESRMILATDAAGKLAFSPDGTKLAYTAEDGMVRVLALGVDDLIDLALERLGAIDEGRAEYLSASESLPPTRG